MAMNAYQKAIRKLVGIQPPDPLGNASGTGVKPTTGAATGESVKPTTGAAGGASPSILPGAPGQGTVSNPVGVPGQAQKQTLPQTNTIYKQAMDAAAPANQQYTSFYKPGEGFGAMGAGDQAIWNGIGQKYAAGDQSYLTDTNQFRDSGNWGSYTDSNGNINGWLQVLNGTGGFAPVFGGKVGETGHDPGTVFAGPDGTAYIAGADGILKPAGTVKYATYGKAPGPGDGSLHGTFRASDGKTYNYDELTPEEAAMFGLVNSPGGGAHIGSVPEMTDQALAQGATTPEIAALVREDARMEEQGRPMPGPAAAGGEGTLGGSGTRQMPFRPGNPGRNTQTAPEKTPYQALLERYGYGKAPEWEGSPYQAERDAALERAKNMEWNYDPNTDPVWQAYMKQYRREGQRAAQDTLGKYAQLTGGQPGSYAATAAAQAGNYYAAQLSDRLPQLYNDAYQRYLDENQRQRGLSDQYADFDQREYDRFSDSRDQWNKDRSFRYGQERDAIEDERYADETAYGRAVDEWERQHRLDREAAEDARYDREWAQKLLEYADEQGWKQTEWQQYLREYGDQLSDQERRWAYQMARDALSDSRYDRQYEDGLEQSAWERGYKERANSDAQYEEAMSFLQRYGMVSGRYAEILGVPAGTTLEEYDAMFGYAPGSGYGETGGSRKRGNGGGNAVRSADALRTEAASAAGERRVADTHAGGQPKTPGYDLLAEELARQVRFGYSRNRILMTVYEWADEGRISDDEIPILLSELGISMDGPSYRNPSVEGSITQWTK